jgi:hypothetical protein
MAELEGTAPVARINAAGRFAGVPAWSVPLLLALPTLALSLVVMVGWKFNGLYGQDPFAYFDYGTGPLRRSLLDGAPMATMFWPLGYPLLVTLASFAFGASTNAAQAVTLLAGASCAVLTFLLGRDVLMLAGADRKLALRAGATGALLFGVTGWAVESSVLATADSTALATSLLSAWALVRWCSSPVGETGGRGWLALSGTALAWSAISRWGQLALAPVWLLAIAWMSRRRLRDAIRDLPWALIPAAAIIGVQAYLIFAVPAGAGVTSRSFAGDLGIIGGGSGGAWSPLHLFQRDFLNPDGAQHYQLPNSLFYATAAFRPIYLTPVFVLPVLVGTWSVASRYRHALVLLIGWPVALLLLDAGLAEQNIRFVLAALPPLAILAGLGVAEMRERAAPKFQAAATLLLAGCLLIVTVAGFYDVHKLVLASRSDLAVASWTAANVSSGATTISFEITLTLAHSTRLSPLDLSELSPAGLRQIAKTRPSYLLVRVSSMLGQWAQRTPGQNYRYARDVLGLTPIGMRYDYTLFRIRKR